MNKFLTYSISSSVNNNINYSLKVYHEASQMHPSPFIWALISKSLKTAPTAPKDSEIILSSDYSLMELLQKIKSDEWRNKIRRIVVLVLGSNYLIYFIIFAPCLMLPIHLQIYKGSKFRPCWKEEYQCTTIYISSPKFLRGFSGHL